MTPRQIELARHALGLPNDENQSYRNRFVAGPGHADHGDWIVMVEDGLAKRTPGETGIDLFRLTRTGAEAVLIGRERLDLEDFPNSH